MPKEINIHDLVQQIWSPDVVDTLPKDIGLDHEGRYHFILTYLTTHVKKCILKQWYTPYIQLKDRDGKYVFNDRLQINIDTNILKEIEADYHFDFINDGTCSHTLYCMTTTIVNGLIQTGFISVDFTNHVNYLNKEDYHNTFQRILETIGAPIYNNLNLELAVLTHQYNLKTKVWNIEFPMAVD